MTDKEADTKKHLLVHFGKEKTKKSAGKVTFVLNCIFTRWRCLITATGRMNVEAFFGRLFKKLKC